MGVGEWPWYLINWFKSQLHSVLINDTVGLQSDVVQLQDYDWFKFSVHCDIYTMNKNVLLKSNISRNTYVVMNWNLLFPQKVKTCVLWKFRMYEGSCDASSYQCLNPIPMAPLSTKLFWRVGGSIGLLRNGSTFIFVCW